MIKVWYGTAMIWYLVSENKSAFSGKCMTEGEGVKKTFWYLAKNIFYSLYSAKS